MLLRPVVLLSFLVPLCAMAAQPTPVFEDVFTDSNLGAGWKISGARTHISLDGGVVTLRSEAAKEHNLTQVVRSEPALSFLQPSKLVRIRTDVTVEPDDKGSNARIMISSVAGQALKGNAVALLINGHNEFRVQIVKDGQVTVKAPNWKSASSKIHRADLELGPVDYTVRVWTEGSETAQEETGPHGLTAEAWGVDTFLALGAWTPAQGTEGSTVIFDNLQVFAAQ